MFIPPVYLSCLSSGYITIISIVPINKMKVSLLEKQIFI